MTKKLMSPTICLMATLILFGLLFVPSSSAQTDSDRPDPSGVQASNGLRMNLELGYFTGRRDLFRELYGSKLNYSLSLQKRFKEKFAWEGRVEYHRLTKNGPDLKYWSASVAPLLIFLPPTGLPVQPIVGGGLGFSHRRVIVTGVQVDDTGNAIGSTTATQKETTAFLIGVVGGDIPLSPRLTLGLRAYFDHYPWGDPTRGDLGDTGGYRFAARIGLEL